MPVHTFTRGISALILLAIVASAYPAPAQPDKTVRLIFVGDIMLDDLPGKAIARGVDPFADFATLFGRADAVIGNLECVVSTRGEAERKPYTFRADPRVIPLLQKHFAAVAVANNHSGDFGKEALREQCDLLEAAGLPYCGGGRNAAEARRPAIIERGGLRIALLSYNDFPPKRFEAGPDSPGIAWIREADLVADVRDARARHAADIVIPFLHWGVEYRPRPLPEQRELARKLIDAGATAVIGGHPHVIQPVEVYRGRVIAYSLGNFVFDGFDEGPERWGWALTLTLRRSQGAFSTTWTAAYAHIDDDGLPHLRQPPSRPGKPARCRLRRS